MLSVKKFFKTILLENEFSSYDIEHVSNVEIDEENDQIKFFIELIDGRKPVLHVSFKDFIKWVSENVENYETMFKEFVSAYISISDTENLKEIVDEDGNIINDDDQPPNSDNSMVGTKNKWDTNTIVRNSTPPKASAYFGSFGNGYVVW